MTNTREVTVTATGIKFDHHPPLEYSATFRPSGQGTGAVAVVDLFNQWQHDGGQFPACDLDEVISMLVNLRKSMGGF